MTRDGLPEGEAAIGELTRALFMLDGDYQLFNMRSSPGVVTADTPDQESERVITDHLQTNGWTVASTPRWARYEFLAPLHLQTLTPEELVRGLMLRNRVNGFPADSMRHVSSRAEGGGETGLPQRLRVWVDVSPEAETYLRGHDYLIRTVAAAVRLRSTARNRHHSDQA